MRQNIVNITNELAAGAGLDLYIMDLYNAILNYNLKNKTIGRPRRNKYELKNGALFINDNFIERVAPLPRRVAFSEAAYIIEGKILAQNEIY